MKTGLTDTSPETEKILIALIRKASPAQRFSRVRSLSKTMIQLSWRAISRANPDLSESEIDLLFVAHHYGEDLANRLRTYLDK